MNLKTLSQNIDSEKLTEIKEETEKSTPYLKTLNHPSQ